jgi:uncharacterized protein
MRLANEHNSKTQDPSLKADTFIVELAALCHDLFDPKYIPINDANEQKLDLSSWLQNHGLNQTQTNLLIKIISNVSYSKEIILRNNGGWTPWHQNCIELHCVMDADKLDAIGAFGIFRCAAFSGTRNFPLYVSEDNEMYKKSAVGHFDDKLFKLEGMMMMQLGKKVARRRTAIMRNLIENMKAEEQLLDFETEFT